MLDTKINMTQELMAHKAEKESKRDMIKIVAN